MRVLAAVNTLFLFVLLVPAQNLAPGREAIPNADVFYADVPFSGYTLRSIITKPKDARGKLPVVFEAAWLSCDSVEQPKGPEDGFTQLLWDIASRSGMATYRVDKPGVGESGGPKCADSDFSTELEAYRAAFQAMKQLPFVDTSRIYVLGFSNGGGFAPLVPGADDRVRAYVVCSGWYKTWYEHMIEHERRRLALAGATEAEVNAKLRGFERFYDLYLNQKLTPAQVEQSDPALKGLWYDEPARQYGRPAAYYQQLQALNLAEAWSKVDAPVLAIHGEYDWVMSGGDYQLLVAALNRRHAGSAEFVEWPKADHGLYIHDAPEKAFHHDPAQRYDPKLSDRVLEWLRTK